MGETKCLDVLSVEGIQSQFRSKFEARLAGNNDQASILWKADSKSVIKEYLEFVGGIQARELAVLDFMLKNKHWHDDLVIKPEDVRRGKTGQIMARVGEFAITTADHPLELLGSVIVAGGSTKCFDGGNFYSITHQWGDSGVWSNDIAVGDYAELNVADAPNPTPLEMTKIVGKMVQHQLKYENDRGKKMNGQARRFVLHVPVNMVNAADQAVKRTTLTGVVDNHRLGSMFSVSVVPNLDLTSTTQIHLFRVDAKLKPFIYQEEVPLELKIFWEDSEYAKLNQQYSLLAEAWYNVGVGVPQYATRATLS